MDTNKHPDQPANNAPEGTRPETADYATWIHDRVRAELKRLRLALGKSAYALAVPGMLPDQAILDIESGKHSPSLKTLALYCLRLGTTVEAVVLAATRPDSPPN